MTNLKQFIVNGVRKMKYYIKKYIKYIIVFLLLNSTIIFLQFLNPILIKKMLELAQINKELIIYSTTIIGSLILGYCCLYLNIIITRNFCKRIKIIESKRLYESMFKVEYSLLKDFDTTYYVTRINDSLNNISNFICSSVSNFAVSIIIICISLIIAATYNWTIAVLFVLLFIVNILCYKKLNLKLQKVCSVLQGKISENFKNIVNVCKNIDFIKQSFKYTNFSEKISNYVENIEVESNKVNICAGKISILIEGLINLIKILVLVFSVVLYFKRQLQLQDIIFIEMILNIYFNALVDLKNTNIGLRDLKASIVFLKDDVFSKYELNNGRRELKNIEEIKFDIKTFSFNNKKDIPYNAQFSVNKGEKVAIVGKSGIGKSTLLNLMLGLYDGDTIYINGENIREYTLESLREKVYVVSQNVSIFPGSIKSNLIIGMENKFDENRLESICKEEFMTELLNEVGGIDKELLDAGGNLSGGQKQKINIARMLIHDPELIIFDESTSALDSESEYGILSDINKYIKGKTIIKISHRFCSIEDMERVVVINGNNEDCEIYSSIQDAIENSESFNSLFQKQVINN